MNETKKQDGTRWMGGIGHTVHTTMAQAWKDRNGNGRMVWVDNESRLENLTR